MQEFGHAGRFWGVPAVLIVAILAAGCNFDASSGPAATAQALSITGNPPSAVTPGQTYVFQPTVTIATAAHYGFTVANKPSWATLDTSTGTLTGTPVVTDVGDYRGIVVSVTSDTESAALPPFTIKVTAAPVAGAPTIRGIPANSVGVGNVYRFTPTASDADGDRLYYSIQNKPAWARFDASTGTLSGTPTAANTGTYANILIEATDGKYTALLPIFSIAVTATGSAVGAVTGTATLSWTSPKTNVDGSPLTDLAGYHIYYGNTAQSMTQTVVITNTALSQYVVTGLSRGSWYFAVRSFNSANVESNLSPVVGATI
jgi:hypothetical protein